MEVLALFCIGSVAFAAGVALGMALKSFLRTLRPVNITITDPYLHVVYNNVSDSLRVKVACFKHRSDADEFASMRRYYEVESLWSKAGSYETEVPLSTSQV